MSSFKGFAPLQTPADLVAKLEHDLSRMQAAPNNAFTAFDFFVTAEHMVDWLYPDSLEKNQKEIRKALRQSSKLLKITSHLANGAKHFHACASHHDSVADLEAVEGGFSTDSFDPRSFSPSSFQMCGLNVHLEDGSVVHTLSLAEDVLHYWQEKLAMKLA